MLDSDRQSLPLNKEANDEYDDNERWDTYSITRAGALDNQWCSATAGPSARIADSLEEQMVFLATNVITLRY